MSLKEKFESLDEVKVWVKEQIKECLDYVVEMAALRDADLRAVKRADEKDLPKFINVKSEAAQEMLKLRLNKEPYRDMEPFLQVLFNATFTYEDYKHLGENDGMLHTLSSMALKLGMKEESEQAYAAVYDAD